MSKDIRVISKECCDIWNGLKDKTKMIDYLIESKQRIAELEEQLKNAIVPKFKKGQKVWFIDEDYTGKYAEYGSFVMQDNKNVVVNSYFGMFEIALEDLFATKEEAQAKLEELKGENK